MREELEPLLGEFPDAVQSVPDLRGGIAFRVEPAALKPFVTRLKERGFDYLSVVTAVDNHLEEPRFETVYVLRSIARNVDLRINVPLPGEEPTVDSLSGLYPAANWMEREVWDLFGIRFEGHLNLERILMWEGFEGHPLRKEYPLLGNSPGTPGYTGKGGKR